MAAETHETSPVEPLFDIGQPGASFQHINNLVLPLRNALLRGARFGNMPSVTLGQGAEYDGVRDYVPGDRPRDVDWKQTVRAAQDPSEIITLKVRERYEDITPNLWIVSDAFQAQNTSNTGYFRKQKLELSAASAILMLARKEGMRTALVASNEHEKIQSHKRPKTLGQKNLIQTSRQLVKLAETANSATEKSDRIHLDDLLSSISHLATRNVVVIVSDFLDKVDPNSPDHGWAPVLQELAGKKNQIIGIQVKSPWDNELPENVDRYRGQGEVIRIGGGKKGKAVREYYTDVTTKNQQNAIDEALIRAGAAHIKLSTDEPRWFSSLVHQLDANRGRRVA